MEEVKTKADNLAKAREAKQKAKEQELPSKKEVAKEPKHSVLDFKIDPTVTYEFLRLDGNTNPRHIPNVVKVWDEDLKKIREIRLTKLEESPYTDDQDPDALLEQGIKFTGTGLHISGMEQNKIKYLLAYDGNVDKLVISPENQDAKGLYKLRDIAKEQEAAIAKEELELEAKLVVKGASDEDLDVFLRAQLGKSIALEYVRTRAYELASAMPKTFVDKFNDPINKIKSDYRKLVEGNIVNEDNGQVILVSSGNVIYNYDPNKVTRVDTEVAKFILTKTKDAKELEETLGL